MKIKILFVITGLNQGGAEEMIFKLLTYIDKNKFECVVVSMRDTGCYGAKIAKLNMPVYCLNIRPGKISLRGLISYVKIVRKIKPDIIQGWMYHANLFSILTKLIYPQAVILFNIRHGAPKYNSKLLTKFVIKINAWLSFAAKAVINNSKESIKLHEDIGFCKKNSACIPNGFDIDAFKPNSHIHKEFRKTHGLDSSTKIIGNIARFHTVKNHMGLLSVFHKIKSQTSSAIALVLCGQDINLDNDQLIKEIERLKLKKDCFLLGSIDTPKIMPAFDVYLSTSWGEGFPNVIGEAMACGVPCVATDVGDCKHIVAEFGAIANSGNYDMLAKHCIEKLTTSDEEKASIRQHIIDHYSIENIVRQYENLYADLLTQKK